MQRNDDRGIAAELAMPPFPAPLVILRDRMDEQREPGLSPGVREQGERRLYDVMAIALQLLYLVVRQNNRVEVRGCRADSNLVPPGAAAQR